MRSWMNAQRVSSYMLNFPADSQNSPNHAKKRTTGNAIIAMVTLTHCGVQRDDIFS